MTQTDPTADRNIDPDADHAEDDRQKVYRPGRAEQAPRKYARRRRAFEISLSILFPASLVLLWQVASSLDWIDNRIYPSPTDIISKTGDLFSERDLGGDIWISVKRILWGYFYGALLGLVVGITMGMFRTYRKAVEPTLVALYTVPKLALLPIYIQIFGVLNRDRTVTALIATTVFFFVWLSAMAAVMAVAEGYREAANSFGVSRWQLFRHVMLPAALPSIFVGLRIAAGVAVLVLVGIEFVLGGDGVGHVINQGRALGLIEQTYVGIVVVAAIGVIFSFLVRYVGRLLSPWSSDEGGFIT